MSERPPSAKSHHASSTSMIAEQYKQQTLQNAPMPSTGPGQTSERLSGPSQNARPANTVQRSSTYSHPTSPRLPNQDAVYVKQDVAANNDSASLSSVGAVRPSYSIRTTSSDSQKHTSLSRIQQHDPTKILESRSRPGGSGENTYKHTTGTIKGVRRVNSGGQSYDNHFQVTVGGSRTQMDNTGQPQPKDVSSTEHDGEAPEETHDTQKSTGERPERSSASKDALSGRKTERSASRGRTLVDKSIEATVKKPETGGQARSRKTSHMMGIWDPQADQKRLERRQLEELHEGSSSPPRPESSGGSRSQDRRPISPQQRSKTTPLGAVSSPPPSPALTAEATLARQAFQSRSRSPTKSQSSRPRPAIPADLLEDIRHQRFTLSETPPVQSPNLIHKEHVTVGLDPATTREIDSNLTVHPDHDEEEHISAAVYYPHPGPTAEEIERFKSPGEISPDIAALDHLTGPRTESTSLAPIEPPQLQDTRAADHIDISVVSKHDKKVFHGEYQPDDHPDEVVTPKLGPADDDAKLFSASESETRVR